ncbi:adrenodoxin-like protein 2, mitochondrial [Glycine soja]|uniref:adrenodoxin-like protein 2, mitochondrial n=1 Tax=Glycine soja TaxID=3848 RepID=UPI0010389720|nr:adrenodoxin-like protein 2, mitochondrial [Glycine soja]XP_040866976.1 adrenodoxin-like protein 2, mitochondrial [Glycine max]
MVKCKFIYKQYDNSSYAIQEAFKGLNFTWDDESTTLIKPKFFCNLFQQNLEQRVAKGAFSFCYGSCVSVFCSVGWVRQICLVHFILHPVHLVLIIYNTIYFCCAKKKKDGEEKHIKVPVGMSMLEAAHENDIELEGKSFDFRLSSLCHVIVMDVEQYSKLEDPTDEENDMLDLAFGLTETSRLGCQLTIIKPECDGIRLAIPAATQNFAIDGYVPKSH